MTPSTSTRVAAVVDDLRARGHALARTEWGATVSEGSGDLADVDAPLAVTRLVDGNPLTVVSTIANAADRGFVPLLVTDDHTREAADPVLSDPFLLREESHAGRSFFAIEDRIRLSDDSYACVAADGAFRWKETGRTDDPQLVLGVGGETVTAFDSVEALTCPGPSVSAFRYSYARGDDGRFRVLRDGAVVGRYTGVGAMRADGFRPVPLPLVPEHHVRKNGRLARQTVLATVADGVTYHR